MEKYDTLVQNLFQHTGMEKVTKQRWLLTGSFISQVRKTFRKANISYS